MSLRDYFSNNKIFTGTEKPTQGKFGVGDIIVNIGPNSAEEPMWICVEAGTPGVWELCSGVNEEEIADIVQANALSAIDYTEGVDIQIDGGEIGNMNELQTTNKSSIVGAINELFQSANNGKELIANAIGEPLNAEDTFSAMSSDINSLLSTFKTNMMNNGVTVESGDKFKALIDKIATMAEEGSGKGIQFAEGLIANTYTINTAQAGSSNTITLNLNGLTFKPTYLFLEMSNIRSDYSYDSTDNHPYTILSNIYTFPFYMNAFYDMSVTITSFSEKDCDVRITVDNTRYNLYATFGAWYAIGVGEEDTTLRDSLASILQEEGVSVTNEDDMASLISKVDSEFENKNATMNDIESKSMKIVPGDTYNAYSSGTYASYALATSTNIAFGNFVCKNSGTYLCTVTMNIHSGSYREKVSCGYTIYDSNGSVLTKVTLASKTLSSNDRNLNYSSNSYNPLNISVETTQCVKAWITIDDISGEPTYDFNGFTFTFNLE